MMNIFLPIVCAGTLVASSLGFGGGTFTIDKTYEGAAWVKVYKMNGPLFEDEVCENLPAPSLTSAGPRIVGTFPGEGDEAIIILSSLEDCSDGYYEDFITPDEY